MSRNAWRLLPLSCANGATQMAIDGAIFRAVESGESPPTLRFYQWDPIAISLGYHQRNHPNHWNDLTFLGATVQLVRRPTGGRAVLHQGDLTYAVIASGFADQRSESYRQICEFLIQGWRSLSYDLSYGNAGRGYIHNPDCFATATGADLVLPTGQKLIGSAQKRSGQTILQQGSMRLTPNPELFEAVFGETDRISNDPEMPTIDRIIDALVDAAETCFDASFLVGSLSDVEKSWISQNLQRNQTK